MEINYRLSMPNPHSHLFHVTMEIGNIERDTLDLVLPVWAPGSYKIRDYPKHVQEFKVIPTGNRPVSWEKVDKNRWRVQVNGIKNIKVNYKVYSFNLSIRSNHLDITHGYFNGVALFFYIDGYKELPSTLTIKPYKNWHVSTGLPVVNGKKYAYNASNYDQLADCPTEIGTHHVLQYTQNNVEYSIALYGEGSFDPKRLTNDLKKITRQVARVFGNPLPFSKYLFIIQCVAGMGFNGLEHCNSTTLQAPLFCYENPRLYDTLLRVAIHEFFHAWNVKSIHTDVFHDFDYTKEIYTETLWVAEGLTSYYDILLAMKCGFIDLDTYFDRLCAGIEQLQHQPGRKLTSLVESSFDTWVKHYQPNENSINTTISYYRKGALVGLIMDFVIRSQTNNKKSLDNVMKYLYRQYGMKNIGFPDKKFGEIILKSTGCDLSSFLKDYVYGTKEIDFNVFLALAGMKLSRTPDKSGIHSCKNKTKIPVIPYLGIHLRNTSGQKLMVSSVLTGTPAHEQGLYAKDEIIALDGYRVDSKSFKERILAKKPGITVKLTVFRDDQLINIPVTLGKKESVIYRLKKKPRPTTLQKQIFYSWSGTRYEDWKEKENPVDNRIRIVHNLV